MYLRNSWYVVAWSTELGKDALTIRALGERLVIFRGAEGAVRILEDRCPHRHLPLSMGKIEGDAIRCGYHGILIGSSGTCLNVPNQATVPPRANIRVYPAAERYGWVWAWMGDPAQADSALIPDLSPLTDPGYRAVGKTNHVRASYQLVVDNLMDLSHAGFVHTSTIGSPGHLERAHLASVRTERGVRVLRTVAKVPAPPTYVKSGRLPPGKLIDRWNIIDYIAPSYVKIHVGGAEAGTGALEGRYEHGLNFWVTNAITPETEETCNYFWAFVRCHALDDPNADTFFLSQVSEAFEEDRRVLEAQQEALSERGDSWANALRADAGSIESRRVLKDLIEQETT